MADKKGKTQTEEALVTGNTAAAPAQTSQQANQSRNADPVSKANAAEINRIYGNDGDPNDPYDRDYTAESAKGYVPTDTTTVNNSMYYAKEQNMTDADRASLVNAGTYYNEAKAKGDEAGMKEAHELAERIRAKYGYSGGTDGSEFISTRKEDTSGYEDSYDSGSVSVPKKDFTVPQVAPLGNRAPDLTDLLDSWLSTAKKQQENKIDYAVNQGVLELQRAEEDAQEQFQTQQNQVDADEAKALDNQALYAEARGDRSGIGQAQYAQIQADAMTNRRTINSARTKLATDTARQMADLRAQGEFQKADSLLELTQTYLSQLMDLEKWSAEFNLSVDQFNTQIAQWNHEFEMAVSQMMGNYQGVPTLDYLKYQTGVDQWNQEFQTSKDQWNQQFQTSKDQWQQEFNYTTQSAEKDSLAASGLAALSVGVRPSAAQQAAMGYTDAQIDAELAAYEASKYVSSGSGNDKPADKAPNVKTDPLGYLSYYGVTSVEQAEAVLSLTYDETYAMSLAEQYKNQYLSGNAESAKAEQTKNNALYGSEYTKALAWAKQMLRNGKSIDQIVEVLANNYPIELLNDEGMYQIELALING